MNAIIDNYINGNLTDAKRGAECKSFQTLYNILVGEYGKDYKSAMAIASYLKGRGSYQAACDAESSAKATTGAEALPNVGHSRGQRWKSDL